MPKTLIHSVSVAEFDQLKGNTLSYVYPERPEPQIQSHTNEALAGLSLPDGGHKHESDSTVILIHGTNGEQLYGFALFCNRKDDNVRRGAKQFALLVIATLPYFDMFRSFLTVAVEEFIVQHDSVEVIKTVYNSMEAIFKRTKLLRKRGSDCSLSSDESDTGINSAVKLTEAQIGVTRTLTMSMWGRNFVMQPLKRLLENEFAGVSLSDFVLRFKTQTMSIWLSLIKSKRILFSTDEKAELVGNMVLSTPLLLGPLGATLVPYLTPYVTLEDVAPVTEHKTYVCGTTNSIFATKSNWYDMVADPHTGRIIFSPTLDKNDVKVIGSDLSFINRIIDGIESGKRNEEWVRFEFNVFVEDFLSVARDADDERNRRKQKTSSVGLHNPLDFEKDIQTSGGSSPGRQQHCKTSSLGSVTDLKLKTDLKVKTRPTAKRKPFFGKQALSVKEGELFSETSLWLKYRWSSLHSTQNVPTTPPPLPVRPPGWTPDTTLATSSSPTASRSPRHFLFPDDKPELQKWRKATAADGRVYYWHAETKERRWNIPTNVSINNSVSTNKPASVPVMNPAAINKIMVESASQQHGVFVDTTFPEEVVQPTKHVNTTVPVQQVASPLSQWRGDLCETKSDQQKGKWILKDGKWMKEQTGAWKETTTEEGDTYYWNPCTGETKWQLPSVVA